MEDEGIRKINRTVKSLISPAPTLKNLKEKKPTVRVISPIRRFKDLLASNQATKINIMRAKFWIRCLIKSKIDM